MDWTEHHLSFAFVWKVCLISAKAEYQHFTNGEKNGKTKNKWRKEEKYRKWRIEKCIFLSGNDKLYLEHFSPFCICFILFLTNFLLLQSDVGARENLHHNPFFGFVFLIINFQKWNIQKKMPSQFTIWETAQNLVMD